MFDTLAGQNGSIVSAITKPFSTATSKHQKLSYDNINPHVKEAQYAVRGELAVKSEQYRVDLKNGKKLPFDTVLITSHISSNIGNPQQLDQKPITFFRQVASLLENPDLLQNRDALIGALGYKSDVVERAEKLLKAVGSVGAYSQSHGALEIRQSVADFIERRDGYPADKDSIYLSNGASGGVNTLLNVMLAGPDCGLLVPIPQYPLYTASLALLNAKPVRYFLDESTAWSTDVGAIRKSLESARAEGTDVRAIVIINPGNPTGASLPADNIKEVIRFAAEEEIVVMADEVYQTNVFEGEFVSFKKCLRELQASPENEDGKFDNVQLASMHSISKGMVGECGHRGGYFELVGFDEDIKSQIYKFISIQLCPPVIGQCLVEMMVNPPRQGEPSYDLYREQYDGIAKGLRTRATALYDAFREMEGVDCQRPQGSMYLFPTIKLPQKAVAAAEKEKRKPDEFYCLRLLDATGVCLVPGSGFGQKEDTLHFRTTFLAPGTDWVQRIVKFHKEFMDEFR
ncbi:PLP-dependent transferase [Myriangium duriaei CBS 260.36]|uniref:Glutamate pyruvate transaminase n=1 Tax=Myriangium duriaei CBS 260.36 TaxID=1168546 RepID=A0A9P4MJU7_9PEZI|nr:PLP-dependent transferase [Myriangium duriaei CBS 260.36]